MKIERTKEYGKFSFAINRSVKPKILGKLKKAIQKKDMGLSNPIIVSSDFKIIDGQHRFMVRKELGLPIFYIQTKEKYDPFDVVLTNQNTTRWIILDYLEVAAIRGDETAKKILSAADIYDVPVNVFLSSLGITVSAEIVAEGKLNYTKKNEQYAKALFSELECFKGFKPWKQQRFIKAYKTLRTLNNYNPDKMASAIKKHPDMLIPQRSRSNYLFKLIEIYNYNKKRIDRVPYPAQDIFEDWGDA